MRFDTIPLNNYPSIIHYLNAKLNEQMNLKWNSEIKNANKHTYDIYMQKRRSTREWKKNWHTSSSDSFQDKSIKLI